MRFIATLAFTLVLSLVEAPVLAQSPKGGAKGATSVPADKAPAAPRAVVAQQVGNAVKVTWQSGTDSVAEYQVYAFGGGVMKAIKKVIASVGRQVQITLQEIADALGMTIQQLLGGTVGFSVEAISPKGLVSPKASSSPLVLKSPAVPGGGTAVETAPNAPATNPAASAGPKDSTRPDKAWAAQTGRGEVTLTWRSAKDATAHRVYFVFNGRRFALGTFVPAVGRAVFTLPRLAGLAGQRVDALVQAQSPLLFEIETLIGQRVGALLPFNQVMPVSAAKGPASKQAPAAVKAEETAPGEITLTWAPVADATAYAIGRASGNEGFRTLCALCPTETRFVDGEATPGVRHVYTVQAVTVDGAGARATSNPVPGESPKTAVAN